jgi:phospholipid transport system substrate-binding protein
MNRPMQLLSATLVALLLSPGGAGAAPKAKRKAGDEAPAPAAAAGPAAPPADSSPLAELRKSNAQLKKAIKEKSPTWSPEHDLQHSEVRKIVGGFLDFEELARRALAKHWDPLTPKQRTDFVSTLRDLAERNYLRQIHGEPDYDLKFNEEHKEGSEATVKAVLNTKAKGKPVSVEIDYKLLWKTGRWLVYDVITDEQSLLENYRAEFNKVIGKDGFDALLAKMKKKLAEKPEQ